MDTSIKKYIICSLDILGTTDNLKNSPSESILYLITEIQYQFIKSILKKYADEKFQYRIFSDNICIFREIEKGDEKSLVEKMIDAVSSFVFTATLVHKMLIRGGITIGDLYVSPNFILGNGLVAAHKLESEYANYARIIVDQSCLIYLGDLTNKTEGLLLKDWDGYYIVNYLLRGSIGNLKTSRNINNHKNILITKYIEIKKQMDGRKLEKIILSMLFHNKCAKLNKSDDDVIDIYECDSAH